MRIGPYRIRTKLAIFWIIGIGALTAGVFTAFTTFTGDAAPTSSTVPTTIDYDTTQLSPGDNTEMTVLDEQEPVSDAEVLVNENNVGKTDSSGRISFDVPSEEFEVVARKGETTISRKINLDDGSSDTTDEGQDSENSPEDDSNENQDDTQDDQQDSTDDGNQDDTQDDQQDSTDDGNQDDTQDDQQDSTDDSTQEDTGTESQKTGIYLDSEPPEVGETNVATFYDQGSKLEGVNVYLNGEFYEQTDGFGEVLFSVPNNQTLKIRGEGMEESWDISGYTQENETNNTIEDEDNETVRQGINLTKDPVVGEYPTIMVYYNDQPLENEPVSVNGEYVDETDQNGEVTYEVPNVQEITISVDNSSIDSLTKQVSGYEEPSTYSLDYPGTLYQGISNTLVARQDGNTIQGADVFVDGESGPSTDNNGEAEFKLPWQDQVEVAINFDGERYNESIEPKLPPIETNFINISGGENVESPVGNMFEVRSHEPVSIEMSVNSEARKDFNLGSDNSNIGNFSYENEDFAEKQHNLTCLDSGSNTLEYQITGDDSNREFSDSVSFETNSGHLEVGEVTLIEPTMDDPAEAEAEPLYDIHPCTAMSYDVRITKDGAEQASIEQGSLEKYKTHSIRRGDLSEITLDPGTYNFTVELENDQTARTDKTPFEVIAAD